MRTPGRGDRALRAGRLRAGTVPAAAGLALRGSGHYPTIASASISTRQRGSSKAATTIMVAAGRVVPK